MEALPISTATASFTVQAAGIEESNQVEDAESFLLWN